MGHLFLSLPVLVSLDLFKDFCGEGGGQVFIYLFLNYNFLFPLSRLFLALKDL